MQQLVQRGVDGELAVADGLDEARAGGRLLRHHLLLPGPLPRSHLGAQAQLVHNLLLGILPGALRTLPGSLHSCCIRSLEPFLTNPSPIAHQTGMPCRQL